MILFQRIALPFIQYMCSEHLSSGARSCSRCEGDSREQNQVPAAMAFTFPLPRHPTTWNSSQLSSSPCTCSWTPSPVSSVWQMSLDLVSHSVAVVQATASDLVCLPLVVLLGSSPKCGGSHVVKRNDGYAAPLLSASRFPSKTSRLRYI